MQWGDKIYYFCYYYYYCIIFASFQVSTHRWRRVEAWWKQCIPGGQIHSAPQETKLPSKWTIAKMSHEALVLLLNSYVLWQCFSRQCITLHLCHIAVTLGMTMLYDSVLETQTCRLLGQQPPYLNNDSYSQLCICTMSANPLYKYSDNQTWEDFIVRNWTWCYMQDLRNDCMCYRVWEWCVCSSCLHTGECEHEQEPLTIQILCCAVMFHFVIVYCLLASLLVQRQAKHLNGWGYRT